MKGWMRIYRAALSTSAWGQMAKWAEGRQVFINAAFLGLILLLAGAQVAEAGKPAPPPPSLGPCIAVGQLNAGVTTQSTVCSVTNVGVTTHTVSIILRNGFNKSGGSVTAVTVAPGESTNIGSSNNDSYGCVVTTQEGTTDALQDLAVSEVVFAMATPTSEVAPAIEEHGTIFNQCAPVTSP